MKPPPRVFDFWYIKWFYLSNASLIPGIRSERSFLEQSALEGSKMTEQAKVRPLNRRQAAKARTREKVLDSAKNLFEKKGYEQTTIRGIAKEAHMSTGAVFANFDDKLDLFAAVLSREYSRLVDSMDASIDKTGAVSETLLQLCMSDYLFCDERDQLAAILINRETEKKRSYIRARATAILMRVWFTGLIQTVVDERRRTQELSVDARKAMIVEAVVNMHLGAVRHASLSGMDMVQYRAYLSPQLSILLSPFLQAKLKAA